MQQLATNLKRELIYSATQLGVAPAHAFRTFGVEDFLARDVAPEDDHYVVCAKAISSLCIDCGVYNDAAMFIVNGALKFIEIEMDLEGHVTIEMDRAARYASLAALLKSDNCTYDAILRWVRQWYRC